MNPFLAYCSKCYRIPVSRDHFFLTSCGNIICQQCLGPQGNCNKCGRGCSRKLISNQMGADVAILFKDPSIEFQRLLKMSSFQVNRYKGYIKYTTARMAHMEKALRESNRKINALELEKRNLQLSINKMKENSKYMKQKQQQSSFHVSHSPAIDPQSSTFANNVMNAIERGRNDGNNTIASASSSCGIFPREPPHRHSFDKRSNNDSIGTPNMPRPVLYGNQFSTNQQNFQSTPMFGHEQIGLNNFGHIRNKPPSSILIPRTRYHR